MIVDGNAGNGAAASIRGGTVVVRGDCAARAGVSMKGGTLLIGGACGYMTGFMMQKGRIVICGDAGEALADSMYEGVDLRRRQDRRARQRRGDRGAQRTTTSADARRRCARGTASPRPTAFRKVVAGRKLWNFDKNDLETWKAAL